jgi:hypothetical protein
VKYVDAFVAASCRKKEEMERIQNDATLSKEDRAREKRDLLRMLRTVREDLLNVDGADFKSKDHAWILEHKRTVLPAKEMYKKKSVYYDIHCNPLDYVVPMLRMMGRVEEANGKLHNAVPLCTSFVPRHITLDTSALIHLFDDVAETLETTKSALVRELQENKSKIWEVLFHTNKSIFRNSSNSQCIFDYMVRTDGVSCCVVQVRRDVAIKQEAKRKHKQEEVKENEEARGAKRKRGTGVSKRKSDTRELYVDELPTGEKERLSQRRIVGVDPGKSDLMYCCTEDGELQFRYTQNQRRKEKKTKAYRQNGLKEKNRTEVDELSIVEWEAVLSAHNHKTVSMDKFKAYIRAKLLVSSKVETFYAEHLFRKQRLYAFFNGRRSEERMVDNFAAKFGTPDEVVVGYGDWKEHHALKFMEPTKGKGLREALRRRGYRVLLVDEYRTSVQCSKCQAEGARCEKFLPRKHPDTRKPESERPIRLVHGLLRCQSCSRLWNRDVNGAINMARLTRCALAGKPRPDYLARPRSGASCNPASKRVTSGQLFDCTTIPRVNVSIFAIR